MPALLYDPGSGQRLFDRFIFHLLFAFTIAMT